MLSFELKKLLKNKTYIILLIVSCLISIYNLAISKEYRLFIVNEIPSPAYGNLFSDIYRDHDLIKDLSDENKEKILDEYLAYERDFYYPWDDARNNDEDYAIELTQKYRDHYLFQDYLLKKYDLKLDHDSQKVWDWGLFESKYMVESQTSFDLAHDVSVNPIRTIIHNDNLIFGVALVVLIVFVFSGIISKERESNTLILLKGQPISNSKIIFSKWLSIIVYGLFYIALTLLLTIILFKLYGYNWHNGHLEIYRVFSDNNLDYRLAYELLILIFIASLIMLGFFASLIILLSSIFKNRYIPAIFLSLILIIFTIVTSKYDVFRSIFNPFYLLNFKNVINGYISSDKELQIIDYSYVKAQGFYPYLFYFVLSFILLAISVKVLDRNFSYNKTKTKTRKFKSVFAFEFYKILEDKSLILVFIGALSILLILFVDISIKNNKARNVLYSDHDTPLMNYYKTSNLTEINNKILNFSLDRNYFEEIYGEDGYEKELENLQSQLDREKEKIEYFRIEKNFYDNRDGKNFYKLRLDQIRDALAKDAIILAVGVKNFQYGPPSYKESLALYEYMHQNDIQPKILAWPVFASDYEEKTIANEINGFDNVFDHSASYIIRKLTKTYPIDLLILSLLAFMVLGGYTYDKDKGNQIDLIYTQPLRKESLYLTKLFAAFFLGFILLSILILFLSGLGLIASGIGDINYPIVHYDKLVNVSEISIDSEVYFSLIPLWMFNLRIFIILCIQLLMLISLANILSLFMRSRFVVITSSLMTFIFGYLISKMLPESIRLYSPFSYLNARYIANGAVKIKEGLAGASLPLIISVMIIFIIGINLIGMFLSRKIEQK